jgi:DNA-3-methyladenine glycosylase I
VDERCPWGGTDAEMVRYHDEEWGVPVVDDRRLFEKICLEGFQSGLSWRTILNKRAAFRDAFDDFDFVRVSEYGDADVQRLLANAGIVRHRGKIEATIHNAMRAREMVQREGSLAAFFWRYEPPLEERPAHLTWEALRQMGQTSTSTRLAKELKARGWRFVGPTTAYAFMQAMGLVNDHIEGCPSRRCVQALRGDLVRPS